MSTNKIKRPDSIQRKENYIAAKMSKLRDDEDQTLLQRAIMKNENSEVTNILIRNFSNADMNYRSRDGVSTLQMAIQEGDANLFKELIDHGINTNGDSFDPSPALDVYIYYGECIEILKMLIDICPDINKKNHFGLTPHDVAIQQSDIATALILEHNGAIPTYASVQSEDVIESLLRHSNTGLIEGLLDQGCTLNIGADEQKTALHLYCTKGLRRPEVLKLLLTHSPEINKKNHDGLTAHDIAIQYGDLETADYIKQHGAKPPVISYFQEAMQSVFG